MAGLRNNLKQCAKCGRTISNLAFKMALNNKPYLKCKCKNQKVSDFIVHTGFKTNDVCRGAK